MNRDEIAAAIRSLQKGVWQQAPNAPVTPITPVGWLCPACGRGNAPTNMTCPCKPWPEMRITC